jgi:two-component system phosphate regulon sensor histidine kinase PhoR
MKYSNDLVTVNLDANYRKVFLSISDKGIEIPEREIDKIFESYYRVDKARSKVLGGTGLGLTIVKHLVEAHKGKISVKSNCEKGSLFKLEFLRYVNY